MHFGHHPGNAPKPPDASTQDPSAGGQATGPPPPPPPTFALPDAHHAFVHDPSSQGPPNTDFRARFHRPLIAPSPFRSGGLVEAHGAGGARTESAPPNGTGNGAVDPHLTTKTPGQPGAPMIDPQLGQARDEAAGVAGKLEQR
ncbi:hypothetical protein NLI96_g9565 [Meripilus lineatus]|uniref:Uncharacterized protein n=1 Tax=Meripilus lineatus TaxID=2056292 RepID=A0AAD5YF35_9APHY|nr:hypothetical protein NLI96_g9565 [Physisporinus lineatus]